MVLPFPQQEPVVQGRARDAKQTMNPHLLLAAIYRNQRLQPQLFAIRFAHEPE